MIVTVDQSADLRRALWDALTDAGHTIRDHPNPSVSELRDLARARTLDATARALRELLMLRPQQLARYLDERRQLGLPDIVDTSSDSADGAGVEPLVTPLLELSSVVTAHRRAIGGSGYCEYVRDGEWSVRLYDTDARLHVAVRFAEHPLLGCNVTIARYGARGMVLQEWTGTTGAGGVVEFGALSELPEPGAEGGYMLVVDDDVPGSTAAAVGP